MGYVNQGFIRLGAPSLPYQLNEGEHSVKVLLVHGTSDVLVQVPDAVSFFVNDTGDTRADFTGPWVGAVRPLLPWDGRRIGDLNEEA